MSERPGPVLSGGVFVVSTVGAFCLWLAVLPAFRLASPYEVLILLGLAGAGFVSAVRMRREDSPDLLPPCLLGGAVATLAMALLLAMASVVFRDFT